MRMICPLCESIKVSDSRRFNLPSLRKEWVTSFGFDPFSEFEPQSETLLQHRCETCDLEFFSPSYVGGRAFYERLSRADWYYQESMWEFDEAARRLRRHDGIRTVLEIGCGRGYFLQKIAPFYDALGTELNEDAAFICRKKGLNVTTGESATLSRKFDAVVALEVLEHLPRPGEFFQEVTEALSPGGLLIVALPNPESYLKELDHVLLDMPPHHATRWSRKALAFAATKFGFDIVGVAQEPLRYVHYQVYRHELAAAAATHGPKSSWTELQRALASTIGKALAPLTYQYYKRAFLGQTHLAEFRKR